MLDMTNKFEREAQELTDEDLQLVAGGLRAEWMDHEGENAGSDG